MKRTIFTGAWIAWLVIYLISIILGYWTSSYTNEQMGFPGSVNYFFVFTLGAWMLPRIILNFIVDYSKIKLNGILAGFIILSPIFTAIFLSFI